jgi:DNA-binding transcriptional regulator YdaS (Cro superfamily)
MSVTTSKKGVFAAIQAAGGQAKLADALGVSQQLISKWLRRGWVPLHRAQEIETQFGVARARLLNPRVLDLVDLPGVESEGGEV